MKQVYIVISLLILSTYAFGQQSVGGAPLSFMLENDDPRNIPTKEYSELDMEKVQSEDEERERKNDLELFSRLIDSDINLENSGSWFTLPNGDRIWRLRITALKAKAINFLYNDFHLTSGSVLHVYSNDKEMVLGGFTSSNNKESGYFATGNIMSESVILELFEPLSSFGGNRISIEKVGYVYRQVYSEAVRQFRGSDPCQVDVACSEANEWRDQEKGVVRILVSNPQGQGWCTGSLINNASLDCAPLILTAWHCADNSTINQFEQFIYYFNYQIADCGGNEPAQSQSITGSSRMAYSNDGGGNSGSDFLLTRLTSEIPSSLNAYYNGWNAVNQASSFGVSIHHPAGDFKKVSTYNSTLQSTEWGNVVQNTHWRVNWAATANGHGVTEGGSSGSPIFNGSGLIIGQLTGGSSFCNEPDNPDLYGKMSYNWTSNGNEDFEQLKNFLDPENTGVLSLQGTYAPCSDPVAQGCTDQSALNYDPQALEDDGSCIYPCDESIMNIYLRLDCYGSETSWELINGSGQVVYSVAEGTYPGGEGDLQTGGSEDNVQLCLPAGCYTFNIYDSFGDGLAGSLVGACGIDGDLEISDGLGNLLLTMDEPNFGSSASGEVCIVELDLDEDGFLASEGDCNDANDAIFPGALEVCDGVDNNCDGFIDENFVTSEFWLDADNDGYGNSGISLFSCFQPDGYVDNPNDCNDSNDEINPTIPELCDGIDNNCNDQTDEGFDLLIWYMDNDNDGYGTPLTTIMSCFEPDGYTDNPDDCNDANGSINPGASEVCNNIDDDCSGANDDNLTTQTYYRDNDNDGYGNPDNSLENCQQPNGYILDSSDCDDTDPNVNPGETEIFGDGIDQDCNGSDIETGISEEYVSQLSIYPNPTDGQITIEGLKGVVKIILTDARGRTVRNEYSNDKANYTMDIRDLSNGAYTIQLISKDQTSLHRIIVK